MNEQLRYKGRFIKKKRLDHKLKLKEEMSKKQAAWHNLNNKSDANRCDGNRIVNLKLLGKNLKCKKCKKVLSLENVEGERRAGLHSILRVKCNCCETYTDVPTGAQHVINDDAKNLKANVHNDLTTNAVLGTLHAGIGSTQLNKILMCLEIPVISEKIYKKYEQEVGSIIEVAAKKSCKRATSEEKQLVLQKIEELREILPEEFKNEFVDEMYIFDEATKLCLDENNNDSRRLNIMLGSIVNIIVSFDMGWSKRGNGKSYDSLNGYGAIIGFLTGKILDYKTRNRKCRMCDLGHAKSDHDCRRNFQGSAKAMEADVGVELMTRSNILKDVGVEVKVIIADEDCTLMPAINRENLKNNKKKTIYKIADMNHVKKNLSKKIYSLKHKFKELNKKGLIKHIKKCFTYALAQCKQNSNKLSATVKCIPDHLFNLHEKCGDWCKSKKNNEIQLKQKFIIKDENLHKELQSIFSTYANNASKYSIVASSNSNESLNSIISYQLPKNKSYSISNSADFRVATSVLLKNEGNAYVLDVKRKFGLSVSQHTELYCKKIDTFRASRSIRSKTLKAKKRRMQLSIDRENLRKNLESREGVTYQSNISFEITSNATNNLSPIVEFTSLIINNCKLVFFDLETSSRYKNADILQIAAKVGEEIFSVYIEPTQAIDSDASQVNGLENRDRVLFFRGEKVNTMSMIDALEAFYDFLSKFTNGALLIAHNAAFDVSYFIREIQKYSLVHKYKDIIYGFCDTLKLLRKKFPNRKGQGMLTLPKLAEDLLKIDSSNENFHEASYDVSILNKLTNQVLTSDDLFKNVTLFASAVNKSIRDKEINLRMKSFSAMKGNLTNYMIKKLALSGITYEELLHTYQNIGEKAVMALLTEIHENKPRITNKKIILNKIIDHLKVVISNTKIYNE